jgi:hypothetical protein
MVYPPEWNKKRKEEDINIQMQAVSIEILGGFSLKQIVELCEFYPFYASFSKRETTCLKQVS